MAQLPFPKATTVSEGEMKAQSTLTQVYICIEKSFFRTFVFLFGGKRRDICEIDSLFMCNDIYTIE